MYIDIGRILILSLKILINRQSCVSRVNCDLLTPYSPNSLFAQKWQITSEAIKKLFVPNTLKMSSEITFHNNLAFICLLNIRQSHLIMLFK